VVGLPAVSVNDGSPANVRVVPLTVAGPAAGAVQTPALFTARKYETPAESCGRVNEREVPAAIVIVAGTLSVT
jgi:hypothetical protein